MKRILPLTVILGIVVILLVLVAMLPRSEEELEQSPTPEAKTPVSNITSGLHRAMDALLPASMQEKEILATNILGADAAYRFEARIPSSWNAEAIEESQSINIYDPVSDGETSLEQSQIFIRSFSADRFLTLSTVTIQDTADLLINDRPARRYTITKKPEVPPFPNQPSWRNEEHVVTDIRVSDTSPSVFYVIAKRPDLDTKIYQDFLENLQVIADAPSIIEPTTEFQERITVKPFGIYIDPQTSPIQPERFTGWHAGVDVEFADVAADVPVRAIADGTVSISQTASGYGGVLLIQHEIEGNTYTALYGHLRPSSMVASGARVSQGEVIAYLGANNSAETDGERKHLHFSLQEGISNNLSGYANNQNELTSWIDPLELF